MFIEAIRCFIPPGLRLNIGEKTQKIVVLEEVDYIDEWIRAVERYSLGMAAILRTLEQNESMPYNELLDRTGASESSIQSLLKRGYIRIEVEETYRDLAINLTCPEFTGNGSSFSGDRAHRQQNVSSAA